jgi:hypothetical protein
LKEGNNLEQNTQNTDNELSLTQQMVKDFKVMASACTHRDLPARITELEQYLASSIAYDWKEIRQQLEHAWEQWKINGDERNEYRNQVIRMLVVVVGAGSGNVGGECMKAV